MTGFEQLGYGQQQLQPQGWFGSAFGGPLGNAIGSGIGGLFGNAGMGGQIGQTAGGFLGSILPFSADPQQMQQGWGGQQGIGAVGGGAQGAQIAGQFLQQHPLLQQIAQHPVLAQQLLATHPLLQQALQNPQAAQQLVQQHPMLQQALQHPLLAHTVMQQHPMLQQALQQQLMQQLQQIQQQQQQQQQFQPPGIGGQQGIGQNVGIVPPGFGGQQGMGGQQAMGGQMQPQGWFGNLVHQYAQPVGSTVGGWLGNQGIGGTIGGIAGQLGQMLPFSVDPYSAWLQQQAMASQYRGMPQYQPGQMMGQGIPGAGQSGQAGAQTLH